MTLLVWPGLLQPEDQMWSPSGGAARDGGRTLAGNRRRSSWAAGGVWRATLLRIAIYTPDMILTAEALDALLNGGAEPIAVPRNAGPQSPGVEAYVPFSDGSTFADGTMFQSGGPPVVLDEAVSPYDTTISFTSPVEIRGGDFSFETPTGPNLHRLARFDTIEEIEGGYHYVAEIRTPARYEQDAGALLNFANPHCTMLLENAEQFAAMLKHNDYGFFDAEFVEA